MFSGSGLEINLLITAPDVAFCIPPISVLNNVAAVAGGAHTNGRLGTPIRDTSTESYKLSNIFLSVINYESVSDKV